MKTFFYAAFAALILLSFSSCHQDPENQTPVGSVGTLEIEMEHMFDTSAFQVNTPYVDSNGDTVLFNSGNYALSHIRLIQPDGSYFESEITHEINLAVPLTAMFTLGNIPNGDYTGVQFALGTDTSSVYAHVVGSIANAAFDYQGFSANGPAFTPIFDFGTVLTIAPNAAPMMHMSVNMETLFANGINPTSYSSIAAGTAESESFLNNVLSAISFEHLHQ